eukprot:CAMPEP_0197197104 /NCGR_PEP_ID=MMETSP1423-20130617/32700_1 /TAXON_ID=476441 /ORGANISM="Pseudo-nitzschia heimii, Strain UNC1101" /LENGTH=229 /DNA_ID=CAMNT_0042650921 /DNA_START=115 /DNA_END=804 /DNA_ORIENTATION=+
MNSVREIENINQQELDRGIAGTSASWHSKYANSAWCYLGNLDHQLTEGDVLCIMSQYGEVDDIHLVREEDTGKSRGFAFLKYEDARSCVLAVDNFCGVKVLGRSLRVDHVEQYRLPKKLQESDADGAGGKTRIDGSGGSGHAYAGTELENNYNIRQGMDLFAPPPPDADATQDKGPRDADKNETRSARKRKEERQQKRTEKEKRRRRKEERREEREDKARRKRAKKYAD